MKKTPEQMLGQIRTLTSALREALHQGAGHSTHCAKVLIGKPNVECNCWNTAAVAAVTESENFE